MTTPETAVGAPDDASVVPTPQGRTLDQNAQTSAEAEHNLTIGKAFKTYRPAVFWSLLYATGVVVAGFDPQLVGTLVAIPTFQKDFGRPIDAQGTYEVEAKWQSAFNIGAPVGEVVGSWLIAYPNDMFGRRWAMALCCVTSLVAVALQISAQSKIQLVISELLNGLVIGAFPVLGPTYISEVTPVVLRGIGAATINLSYVTGQLIASGVLAGTQNRTDRWAYDIPFACQLFFPLLILVILPFSPESPWWLVRQGRSADAEASLKRLTTDSVDTSVLLENIERTTRLEMETEESSKSSFADCFKGTDLRRTIISTAVFSIQPLCGNYLITGYVVYFFELAGLAPGVAFDFGVGVLGVGWLGSVLAWPLIARFGRRTIFIYGLSLLTILVLLVALLDFGPRGSSVVWAQSSMMLLFNFFYDLTIGPVAYVIMSETSSARLRGKTVAIATVVNAIIYVACGVGVPYAINQDQGNLRGKLAFVFFGFSILGLIYCWFYLPETKGRTFEELDIMFVEQVPTKQFAQYDCATLNALASVHDEEGAFEKKGLKE